MEEPWGLYQFRCAHGTTVFGRWIITEKEKGLIVSEAAKSDCGKKQAVRRNIKFVEYCNNQDMM